MLNRLFGKNTHLFLHILGLSGLSVGIPTNKVVMSVSMMFLVLNLLLEADFSSYWKNLKANKLYLFILGFFLLHVLGLLWSSNMQYALHDLNGKLPLLVIPTILAAKPLTERKHLEIILKVFTFTVVLVSLLNFALYQHWFGNVIYNDIRGLSHFSSHVRFAIIVSMAIAVLFYFFRRISNKYRVAVIAFILWLVFYTLYSQVISGLLTMVSVFTSYWVFILWRKSKILAVTPLIVGVGAFIIIAFWLFKPSEFNFSRDVDFKAKTTEGNFYTHVPDLISAETDEAIYIYICKEELHRDWSKYSSIPYDSLDVKGQVISETIIRYLSSKKLRKDAKGLSQLSEKEIKEIENGITSANHKGLLGRLYGIKYQLTNAKNPNGHSLLERLEYWKTGFQIASNNLFIGVGTGDVQDAFNTKYEENNSLLREDKRRRAHNYFLTILITFGITGLLYFLYAIGLYAFANIRRNEILATSFIVIVLVSFLIEDSIETQTGVTFFALFYGLFSYKLKNSSC